MALVKCGECGKEISDSAGKCPHCGKGKVAWWWPFSTIGALMIIGYMVWKHLSRN